MKPRFDCYVEGRRSERAWVIRSLRSRSANLRREGYVITADEFLRYAKFLSEKKDLSVRVT